MINKTFYKENNLVSIYHTDLQHYLRREPAIVLITRDYQVQYGETMYSIAKDLFDGAEYNWTIIGDINPTRMPDDLIAGEIIKLPQLIVSEARYNQPDYAKSTSTTTKV